MIRNDKRIGLALLAMVALTSPAVAEEQGGDWFGAVGDFVRAGLGPARTMDDIRRDEERAREAAPAKPDAAPAPRAAARPAPLPAPSAPAVEAEPAPAVAAPATEAHPLPKPARAVAAPAPVPVPVARPKPAVPVAARVPTPPPPPEPLSSRIAATATLDQAIKLGGSADAYGKRPVKPVGN